MYMYIYIYIYTYNHGGRPGSSGIDNTESCRAQSIILEDFQLPAGCAHWSGPL